MNEKLKQVLDKKFYEAIADKDNNNPKVLITFSGVPFSGRTAVAKELTQNMQGLYVDKDLARTLIYENENIQDTQQPEDLLDEYMPTVFNRLTKEKNGIIILDASIDRKFDEYKKWADDNSYKMIVINLEVDRDVAEEAIKAERDEKTAIWFGEQFDRWYADHEKFKAEHEADFTVRNIAEEVPIMLERLNKEIR